MRRSPAILIAAVLLLAVGCGGDADPPAREQLTQWQRDSAIAASRLPGAAGVGRALQVADSVSARTGRLDSLYRVH